MKKPVEPSFKVVGVAWDSFSYNSSKVIVLWQRDGHSKDFCFVNCLSCPYSECETVSGDLRGEKKRLLPGIIQSASGFVFVEIQLTIACMQPISFSDKAVSVNSSILQQELQRNIKW